MIENLVEKVISSADVREKAVQRLGFDEPPITEKLSRSDFGSDEAYFHACAELAVRNRSPEYRAEYQKIRREYNARKAEEEQAAADKEHQKEIEQAIRDCVLRPEEQNAVDERARKMAQADLAAGKIVYSQMAPTVERYAALLTEEEKTRKVYNFDMNRQIREAMATVLKRG